MLAFTHINCLEGIYLGLGFWFYFVVIFWCILFWRLVPSPCSLVLNKNRQRWATCVPSVLAPLSTCASSPCGLVCILPVMSYLHFAVCVLVLFWLVLLLVATVYSFFYFVCRLHQFCCQPFCFWIIGFWARTSALTKARFEFLPACSVPCVWLLFQITLTLFGCKQN